MRFLPVFLDLTSGTVALVGSSAAAINKLRLLRSAGASVRWYSGSADVAEEVLLAGAAPGRLELSFADPLAADYSEFAAVVAATGTSLDADVVAKARAHNVPVNVVDRADLSDFIVPAIVDRDPVVILDGLTKNWRYPGWRVTWAVGPRSVVDTLASAGSFLDGGGSKPLQRAAIPLLEYDHVVKETRAIHDVFRKKRDHLVAELQRLGVRLDRVPDGTFYAWGNVADLPAPLDDGMGFFRAALEHKVITVPGEFFDVNPGKRRRGHGSRFGSHVRFSFGPPAATIDRALERLETLIKNPPPPAK